MPKSKMKNISNLLRRRKRLMSATDLSNPVDRMRHAHHDFEETPANKEYATAEDFFEMLRKIREAGH